MRKADPGVGSACRRCGWCGATGGAWRSGRAWALGSGPGWAPPRPEPHRWRPGAGSVRRPDPPPPLVRPAGWVRRHPPAHRAGSPRAGSRRTGRHGGPDNEAEGCLLQTQWQGDQVAQDAGQDVPRRRQEPPQQPADQMTAGEGPDRLYGHPLGVQQRTGDHPQRANAGLDLQPGGAGARIAAVRSRRAGVRGPRRRRRGLPASGLGGRVVSGSDCRHGRSRLSRPGAISRSLGQDSPAVGTQSASQSGSSPQQAQPGEARTINNQRVSRDGTAGQRVSGAGDTPGYCSAWNIQCVFSSSAMIAIKRSWVTGSADSVASIRSRNRVIIGARLDTT